MPNIIFSHVFALYVHIWLLGEGYLYIYTYIIKYFWSGVFLPVGHNRDIKN